MKNNRNSRDFFSEVLEGIRKASRKMAQKSAANDQALVINGKPISVPACEHLKNL